MKRRGFVDVEDGIDRVSKGLTLVVKRAELYYGVSEQALANYGLLLASCSWLHPLLVDHGWLWLAGGGYSLL